MFPPSRPLSAAERRLLGLFHQLNEADRHSLTAFAEFLVHKQENGDREEEREALPAEPRPIPRPRDETVVGAMRRLRDTYPMVDPDRLLDEASGLMSAHLLGGRPASEVIDELEALFERHFFNLKNE